MNYLTDNTRIVEKLDLVTPSKVIDKYPLTEETSGLVYGTRNEISQILHGKDDRLVVICGPCSICLLYTSPSPRDGLLSRMPSSA